MVDFSSVLDFGGRKQFGSEYKNNLLKKSILVHLADNSGVTISELAKELNVSVPTVTKLLADLKEEGYLEDNGKIETAGGRRPNVFGLASDVLYIVGVDVQRKRLEMVLLDFQGKTVCRQGDMPYELKNTPDTLEKICHETELFIQNCSVDRRKIAGVGFSLTGRVNPNEGYSYTYFNFQEMPLAEMLGERIGIPVYIENDSRCMMFAEKKVGVVKEEKNVLFLNLGRGIGVGAMFDGRLYYGKSGFSGEFGHIPLFSNEIMCHCGKKGCLETEASGIVLEKEFLEHLAKKETSLLTEKWENGEEILLYDIVKAANNDDMLSISLITEVADKLGRGIGVLMNLLNPDLVVIGGSLSLAGDYLMLPLKAAVNKYSLSLVSKDTCFKLSSLGEEASAIGAALLVRGKILGNI